MEVTTATRKVSSSKAVCFLSALVEKTAIQMFKLHMWITEGQVQKE